MADARHADGAGSSSISCPTPSSFSTPIGGSWPPTRPAAALAGADERDLAGRAFADVLDPRDAEGRSVLGECWPAAAAAMRSVVAMPECEYPGSRRQGVAVLVRATARYLRDDDGSLTGAVRRPPPGSAAGRPRADGRRGRGHGLATSSAAR